MPGLLVALFLVHVLILPLDNDNAPVKHKILVAELD